MEIPLQHGLFAIIDDADHALVRDHHWYAQRHRNTWYALAHVKVEGIDRTGRQKRTTIKMHRIILAAKVGEQIDHSNGDGLDNRRLNIAIATHAQNQQNQHKVRAQSGLMGVARTKSGKWAASIKRNRKMIYLGTFPTSEAAVAARASFAVSG